MLPGQSEALAALVLTTQKPMAGTKVAKAAGNSRRRRRHVLVVLGRAGVVVGAAVAVAVAGETLCTGMLVIRVFNKVLRCHYHHALVCLPRRLRMELL